jgi:hypothetical protein
MINNGVKDQFKELFKKKQEQLPEEPTKEEESFEEVK